MRRKTIELRSGVLDVVETLDGRQDRLTAENPRIIAELRQARRQDKAGKFKAWLPKFLER